MVEEIRIPTVQFIRDEIAQIESEAMLYSVPGAVDEEMAEIVRKIEIQLGIITFRDDPSNVHVHARLVAVRDTLLEKLWGLHENHLPERSERLFLDDLCTRQGSPVFAPNTESQVRVTPLVDYTLGHPPARIYLPAGSTVSFDIDGEPPRQTVILAAEGGWSTELSPLLFPRKGMLVGRTDDFDRWVSSSLPSIRLDR